MFASEESSICFSHISWPALSYSFVFEVIWKDWTGGGSGSEEKGGGGEKKRKSEKKWEKVRKREKKWEKERCGTIDAKWRGEMRLEELLL